MIFDRPPLPSPAPTVTGSSRLGSIWFLQRSEATDSQQLFRDGVVKDCAEIARQTGLTRARVTQIVNLTLRAPEIQEGILAAQSGVEMPKERTLRYLTSNPDWESQELASQQLARLP